jgi:alanine racemase
MTQCSPRPVSTPNDTTHRRAWAEINLDALRHNLDIAVEIASSSSRPPAAPESSGILVPVIKANAYGHGAPEVAAVLARHPATAFLGVACAAEARQLADVGIPTRIYLLGPSAPGERSEIVARRWTPCLSSLEEAKHFSDLARDARLDKPLPVHIALDTGMGRGGFLPHDFTAAFDTLRTLPHLQLEGLGSHLPSADEDPGFTHDQIKAFSSLARWAQASGWSPAFTHVHNSAGLLGGYDLNPCNLFRPGLMLYGASPLSSEQHRLQPVLTLKTRVTLVRTLPENHGVSYGRTFITNKPTLVATLGIGYGDGYPRNLSNQQADALISGRRCPLLGRVTMDQIIVDVSHLPKPPAPGDEAVLIGSQGTETILASELAQKADTIPWEIFTRLTKRVTRLYDTASASP